MVRNRGTLELSVMAAVAVVAVAALLLSVRDMVRAGPGAATSPAVPTVMSYQGRLADPGTSSPVADGTYNMLFRIFSVAAGGTPVWQEPAAGSIPVQTKGGLFTHLLGSDVPLSPSVFSGSSAYLEVEVNGETLAPRQQIAAVAYAMVAETLDGQSLSDLDDRFLNVIGDTMSGDLSLRPAAGLGTSQSALQTTTIELSPEFGRIRLGATGEDGDVVVRNDADETTVHLDGDTGRVLAGGPGEDGDVVVRNDADETTAHLDGDTGNVTYAGALIGAFPVPAYDSGFVPIATGRVLELTHGIGGNPEDYVVDLRCRLPGAEEGSIHNRGIGGDRDTGSRGVQWWLPNTGGDTIIKVMRLQQDSSCLEIDVRIWLIKQPGTGSVSGEIRHSDGSLCDPTQFPLFCEAVSLCPQGQAWDSPLCTERSLSVGTFSFVDVPAGDYTIYVICGGCFVRGPIADRDIHLEPGQHLSITITLL